MSRPRGYDERLPGVSVGKIMLGDLEELQFYKVLAGLWLNVAVLALADRERGKGYVLDALKLSPLSLEGEDNDVADVSLGELMKMSTKTMRLVDETGLLDELLKEIGKGPVKRFALDR